MADQFTGTRESAESLGIEFHRDENGIPFGVMRSGQYECVVDVGDWVVEDDGERVVCSNDVFYDVFEPDV